MCLQEDDLVDTGELGRRKCLILHSKFKKMSSNRKRRVSLVTTDTPDDVSLLTSTGGNFEQKLMTRASKRRKMALSTNTMTEESTDAIKLGDTQKLGRCLLLPRITF